MLSCPSNSVLPIKVKWYWGTGREAVALGMRRALGMGGALGMGVALGMCVGMGVALGAAVALGIGGVLGVGMALGMGLAGDGYWCGIWRGIMSGSGTGWAL